MDGAFDTYWQEPSTSPDQLSHINNALNATLDPRISNDVRKQALHYLEQVKHQPDAPHYGFTLADDWKQSDAIRYYGLQLLEHAVRYRWSDYSVDQTEQLRTWVKWLAGSMREQDALYIRNKIAQLWVEVAKRCWGDEWMDMDSLLVTLWEKPMSEKGSANKILVLCILETLSEDIVNSEDAAAGLRLDVLGNALNEIMVPVGLYAEFDSTKRERHNSERHHVRSGDDGWLARVYGFFATCVKQLRVGGQREMVRSMSFCAVKALHALRPTMAWINLKAAVEVNAVDCLFLPFHTEDVALQIAATEVLYALLSRPHGQHWHETWLNLLQQALQQERISLFTRAFEQIQISPGEDDERYTLQKKLSETLSVLADAIAQHPELASSGADLSAFFELLLQVLQSNSLVVSIPILHSWTKLMAVQDSSIVEPVLQALGTLLQTCSSRLLRYESLHESDASGDEIVQFLNEDFDTMPERHAFLGNYRRYCVSIIQTIARTRPTEALSHVLSQTTEMLETGPYSRRSGLDTATYSKTNLSVLHFDAQQQVVSSALKGFSQWLADVASVSPEHEVFERAEKDKTRVMTLLQGWSSNIMTVHVDDPEVAALVLGTLVSILRTIKPDSSFVLSVVEHFLTMDLPDDPRHATFSDAVKVFEGLRVLELQKLGIVFADELLEVYQQIESRVDTLVLKYSDEPRLVWGYKTVLFIIIRRASGIDSEARLQRLQQILRPVYDAWQNPGLSSSLADLQIFCNSLGLGDLAEFYKTYRFAETPDWAAQPLDEAGQAKQAEIKAKSDGLPLRMTKSMLTATTEKLKSGSHEYEVGCALWADIIPVVLPNLLKMLRHAQAFHNLANWSQLPDELQIVVRRTLQDRFWQSGISNESRDEFYARINGSRTSYEGFASVVRGAMRNIREQGYHIVYLMTKFEEQFYGLSDLAEPLAEALFADASALSANHLHPIINLTTGLVQRCPPHHRAQFLPPLLTQLFKKLDAKISSEWDAIGQASHQNAEEEELSDEMRMESVLRQLTYSMVSFVPFLLEFDRASSAQQQTNGHAAPSKPTLSDLVLSDPAVLEPLIIFCTHALRMRDTRCCVTVCRVFRSIVPLFQSDEDPAPQVREFICTEVLKACITSLNEPYFADMQKDLAALIAQVILLYAPRTSTPRNILCSLSDISESKVDRTIGKIAKAANERQQRALVLDLLEGVRGVSIYEAGKINIPKKSGRKAVQQQYMEVEQKPTIVNGDEAGLDGVAGLFGDP